MYDYIKSPNIFTPGTRNSSQRPCLCVYVFFRFSWCSFLRWMRLKRKHYKLLPLFENYMWRTILWQIVINRPHNGRQSSVHLFFIPILFLSNSQGKSFECCMKFWKIHKICSAKLVILLKYAFWPFYYIK